MITAAVVAASDGPPAVEPRFYEKAIAWDETAAQRENNRRLGWTVAWDAAIGPGAARVRISDASGAPILGATCTVEYFHRAHSRARQSATLVPAGDGVYKLPDALRAPGDHEFRLSVRADAGYFTCTSTASAYAPAEVPGS